ncbi:MAG TPA: alpha/beta hydrolase [Gemmataceae bacterium]|nr:alpha/beta hydrolase [Gemmataceae bacterium]
MGNNFSWTRRCSRILALITLRYPAFWERSWKHRVARLAIYLAGVYVGIMLALLCLEDFFLFGPRNADMVKPPPGVAVQNVEMTSVLGDRIHAWWSTPKDWRPEQGAVLFCHGNAGNLSYRRSALPHWINEMDVAVLLFDYPGFGLSSGETSESGCYAAGDAAYEWLGVNQKVPAERIILYGGSLGSGIATDLASRRPHRALVLVASFTSFPDMAQTRYPWLPGRWLVHNRFDNLRKIADCHGPVFIAHGTRDGLIPFAHGERLFAAASEPKRFFAMTGYPHNDLTCDAFFPALRDFLAECERPAN